MATARLALAQRDQPVQGVALELGSFAGGGSHRAHLDHCGSIVHRGRVSALFILGLGTGADRAHAAAGSKKELHPKALKSEIKFFTIIEESLTLVSELRTRGLSRQNLMPVVGGGGTVK